MSCVSSVGTYLHRATPSFSDSSRSPDRRWPSMPSIHSRASLAAAGVNFSSRSRFKSRSKDMVMLGWLSAVGSDSKLRRGSPGTRSCFFSFAPQETGNDVSGGWRRSVYAGLRQ